MPDRMLKGITDIIKSDFRKSFSGGRIVLQDSTCDPININKKGGILCLQPDSTIKGWKNNFPFFETSIKDLCKVSDYLIIYPTAKTLFVFIVELKTSKTNGAIEQLRASFELSKYICGTANRILEYPNIDIEYRGLIFSNKMIIKGHTKPKSKYTIDNKSNLLYKHLHAGMTYDLDSLCL